MQEAARHAAKSTTRTARAIASLLARRPSRLAGARRLEDGVAFAACTIAALLYARTHVSGAARWLAERSWDPRAFATILVHTCREDKCGMTQYYAYGLTLALVAAASLALGAIARVLSPWRHGRGTLLALYGVIVVATVIDAIRVNAFVGKLALCLLFIGAVTLAPYCGRAASVQPPPCSRTRAGVLLVSEALALSFAVWLVASPRFGPVLLVVILAALVVAGIRTGRALREGDRVILRDAYAGLPLLALPFLGLQRAPSYGELVSAGIAVVFLRFALQRWSPREVPEWLVAIVAPTAVAAIFLLPLAFRDLPTANHFGHESQHLAWMTSAMHGKLLFADAGFTYPPGREYLLMLVAWAMGGVRLDHVRLAHVFLNLAGVAMLLYVGWHVVRRRLLPFALWWWLILVRTPTKFFLNYPHEISFGWADDARAGFATLALFMAVRASDTLFAGEPRGVRGRLPLFAAGLLGAFAVLYSHDSGLAAIVSAVSAIGLGSLLHRREGGWAVRCRRGLVASLTFVSGVAVGIGVPALYYLVRGRGPLLMDLLRYEAVLATGMSGALSAFLDQKDFLEYPALFGEVEAGWKLDYYLPLFVSFVGASAVIASALRARWSSRTSLLAALTLFSALMFRYGLMRADPWHISAASVPAYLLLASLVADAVEYQPRLIFKRPMRVPLGGAVFACLTILVVCNMPSGEGLAARANRIGTELPSAQERYHSDGIVRAGDEKVESWPRAIAQYVREHTRSYESIWVVASSDIGAGEIYFLSDRVDATPFDVRDEVVTRHDVDRIMKVLRSQPPALIVGDHFDYTSELAAYVRAHWKLEATVEGVEILRYDPSGA